jgi:hypothetical protein
MAYIFRKLSTAKTSFSPFSIVPFTGTAPQDSGKYMVTPGVCFSQFNYSPDTYIPIQGLGSGFDFEPNNKVYLDFTIYPNQQVSGVFVKCSKVGKNSVDFDQPTKSNPDEWPEYPSMTYIVPKDTVNENGLVTQVAAGKRQTKLYCLIGHRSDDTDLLGINENPPPVQDEDAPLFSPINKLGSHLLLFGSQVSGVPVLAPMPWFKSLYQDDNV